MVSVSRDFGEASVLVLLLAVEVRESIRKPRKHSMYTKGRRSGRGRAKPAAESLWVDRRKKEFSEVRRQHYVPLDNSRYNMYYSAAGGQHDRHQEEQRPRPGRPRLAPYAVHLFVRRLLRPATRSF